MHEWRLEVQKADCENGTCGGVRHAFGSERASGFMRAHVDRFPRK